MLSCPTTIITTHSCSQLVILLNMYILICVLCNVTKLCTIDTLTFGHTICHVITGWFILIVKITRALMHVSPGSHTIHNKNSICNFHYQYLPELLVQQMFDVANMCVAVLCMWRLAIVHCINWLSEPGVLM